MSAIALAEAAPYDVAVLDRGLPDIDGITVMRLLRAKGIATPVLLLTALGSVDDRVAGLDAGADDYLAKPFAFSELLARIRALGRRPAPAAEGRMAAGDLVLDELRHVAQVGDRTVDLSAREFALLGYLIRHAGQVVTRQQILDAVWGAEPDVYSNVVDLYVHYLRRKLGSSAVPIASGRCAASATCCVRMRERARMSHPTDRLLRATRRRLFVIARAGPLCRGDRRDDRDRRAAHPRRGRRQRARGDGRSGDRAS